MKLIAHSEEQAQRDKLEAQQIVAAIPLIDEIERIDVELYTDNTGDPAFQLVFYVRPNVEIGKDFIKKFNRYAARIQTHILHSNLQRFPYTKLQQVA